MARQYLQDDGFAEPAVADPLAANAAGTAAAYDHSVTQSIWISKTLSVAGSWTTQFVDFAAMN
jgi:hypothetical protein